MLDLLIPLGLAFVLYCVTVLRQTGTLTANALFVYAQAIMAAGTLPQLDPALKADTAHSYIIVYSTLAYMVISGVLLLHHPRRSNGVASASHKNAPVQLSKPSATIGLLIALSVLITIVYYWAVGYSALLEGINNTLSGGSRDIAGQRLASYSGKRYLFPGYVNQFKNVLLPSLAVITFTFWIRSKRRRPYLRMILLSCVTVFGLLGTGQRGALIQFAVVITLYLYLFYGRRLPKSALRVGLGTLSLVVLATISLGRSNVALTRGASSGKRVVAALSELGARVFHDQQLSSLTGFRYIYRQPVQWGQEWATALAGLLPGQGGSDLSNRIFSVLYGSNRGTSPPSIWGSVYHNFGWPGVILFPALLAVVLVVVTHAATQSQPRTSMELIGIAGVSSTLGLWAAGSPDYLFNSGLAVYLGLWAWGAHTRSASAPGHDVTDLDVSRIEPLKSVMGASVKPVAARRR